MAIICGRRVSRQIWKVPGSDQLFIFCSLNSRRLRTTFTSVKRPPECVPCIAALCRPIPSSPRGCSFDQFCWLTCHTTVLFARMKFSVPWLQLCAGRTLTRCCTARMTPTLACRLQSGPTIWRWLCRLLSSSRRVLSKVSLLSSKNKFSASHPDQSRSYHFFSSVNQNYVVQPNLPFGGWKESGLGREGALEDMLEHFTKKKTISIHMK